LIDVGKNPDKNFVLQDGDLARIYTVVDIAKTVTITGAVIYPGEYGVNPGVTTVKDVINLAGGLLYFASNQAEVTRLTVTQAGPKTDIFAIDLAKALEGDPQNNAPLQRNDYLLVRAVPEWDLYRKVSVSGEVRFPGTYTIQKGETLSSLIARAGGFTDKAYLKGTMFTREKVRQQQQKQIDEMAERLERELLGVGTAQVAAAASSDEARLMQMEMEQKKAFISQLKAARAKGRIALRLAPLEKFKDTTYDIEMEQGDALMIPSDPKTVQVIGSVYNQSAFVYEKGQGYDTYVTLAGGYSTNADDDHVYILKADGFATRANGGFLGLGSSVESGDTIVVPEQLERIAWMRNFKDITQIIYQIAVSAGVLIVVF
jgi:protein involved in polysaccharide export with SLBB domain